MSQDALDHRIGLGMDGRGIERIVAVADAQKAGRLLERLGPEARHSLQRLRRLRKGPILVATRTMFSASDSESPETRASSGADAVFTSTPTALTQSSTTASSVRASFVWPTSCWY